MWDSMKSLESKYIDLANYYKKELHQTQINSKLEGADTMSHKLV